MMAAIQSVYDRLPGDGRLLAAMRGANQFMFSDDGALLKSQMVRTLLRSAGGSIDGCRQLEVTTSCGGITSTQYPEIQVFD